MAHITFPSPDAREGERLLPRHVKEEHTYHFTMSTAPLAEIADGTWRAWEQHLDAEAAFQDLWWMLLRAHHAEQAQREADLRDVTSTCEECGAGMPLSKREWHTQKCSKYTKTADPEEQARRGALLPRYERLVAIVRGDVGDPTDMEARLKAVHEIYRDDMPIDWLPGVREAHHVLMQDLDAAARLQSLMQTPLGRLLIKRAAASLESETAR